MAYGTLLRRAWQLVWNNKFLIVIGASPQVIALVAAVINSVTGALGSILIFGAAIVIQGWIISAVVQIVQSGGSSYRQSWDVTWPKKWTLAGIAFLAGLPGGLIATLIFGVIGAIWALAFILASLEMDPRFFSLGMGAGALMTVLLCGLLIVVSLPFTILSRLTEITCLREGTGVTDSFSRAWQIIRPNLRQVVGLGLIQLAISILSLVILLPAAVLSICPLAWPLTWGLQGFFIAWWLAVWTLAWLDWSAATNQLPPRI